MRSWAQWQGRRDHAQEALGWPLAHPHQTCRVDLGLCETLADPLQPCVAIFNGGWVRVFQREPVFDRYADGIVSLVDPSA